MNKSAQLAAELKRDPRERGHGRLMAAIFNHPIKAMKFVDAVTPVVDKAKEKSCRLKDGGSSDGRGSLSGSCCCGQGTRTSASSNTTAASSTSKTPAQQTSSAPLIRLGPGGDFTRDYHG